jgi:hypothetical protein
MLIGSILVLIPIKKVIFYVLDSKKLFLLYL